MLLNPITPLKNDMKRTLATLALAVGFLAAPSASVFAEDFEITIIAGKMPLQYDTKEFTVKAGQTVKITLSNESVALQPHNLIVLKPGKFPAMLAVVNDPAKLSDPKWIANPIPESDDILHYSKLLKRAKRKF